MESISRTKECHLGTLDHSTAPENVTFSHILKKSFLQDMSNLVGLVTGKIVHTAEDSVKSSKGRASDYNKTILRQ